VASSLESGFTRIDLTGFTFEDYLPIARCEKYPEVVRMAESLHFELLQLQEKRWLEGGVRLSGEHFLGIPGTIEIVPDANGRMTACHIGRENQRTELIVSETSAYRGALESLIIELPDGREVGLGKSSGTPRTLHAPSQLLYVAVPSTSGLGFFAELDGKPVGRQELRRLTVEENGGNSPDDYVRIAMAFGQNCAPIRVNATVRAVGRGMGTGPDADLVVVVTDEGGVELARGTRGYRETFPQNTLDDYPWGPSDPRNQQALKDALEVLAGGVNRVRYSLASVVGPE
jgi:hypothetical protein